MTKKVRRPDGTEEEVTGTAEEIAAYERLLRGEVSEQKKKPPVLKGGEVELDGEPVTDDEVEYIRSFRKFIRDPNTFRVPYQPYVPPLDFQPYEPYVPQRIRIVPNTGELWNPCRWCGKNNCMDAHIICGTTTTSNSIEWPTETRIH